MGAADLAATLGAALPAAGECALVGVFVFAFVDGLSAAARLAGEMCEPLVVAVAFVFFALAAVYLRKIESEQR